VWLLALRKAISCLLRKLVMRVTTVVKAVLVSDNVYLVTGVARMGFYTETNVLMNAPVVLTLIRMDTVELASHLVQTALGLLMENANLVDRRRAMCYCFCKAKCARIDAKLASCPISTSVFLALVVAKPAWSHLAPAIVAKMTTDCMERSV
jgi:hypothetical protein